MAGELRFQIGKAGVTDGVIASLTNSYKKHKTIRISALKGSGRDKESIQKMAAEIAEKLPGEYAYTVIGFTIVMRRKGKLPVSSEEKKRVKKSDKKKIIKKRKSRRRK